MYTKQDEKKLSRRVEFGLTELEYEKLMKLAREDEFNSLGKFIQQLSRNLFQILQKAQFRIPRKLNRKISGKEI